MPSFAKRLSVSGLSKRKPKTSDIPPLPLLPAIDLKVIDLTAFAHFPAVPARVNGARENLPTPQEYFHAGLSPKSLPRRLRSVTMVRSSAQSHLPYHWSENEEADLYSEDEEAVCPTPELVASSMIDNSRYSSSGSSSSCSGGASSSRYSMDATHILHSPESWIDNLGLATFSDDDVSNIDELEAELYLDLMQSASVWGSKENIEHFCKPKETSAAPSASRPSSMRRSLSSPPKNREQYEDRPLPDAPTDVRRSVPAPIFRPTFSRQVSNLSVAPVSVAKKDDYSTSPSKMTYDGRVMEVSGRASVELCSRWSMDSEPEERLLHAFKPAALVGHFRGSTQSVSRKSSIRRDGTHTPAMSRTSSAMSNFSFNSLATASDFDLGQVFDLTRPDVDYRRVYALASDYATSTGNLAVPLSEKMLRSQTLPTKTSKINQPVPTSKSLAFKLLNKSNPAANLSSRQADLKDRSYHLRR